MMSEKRETRPTNNPVAVRFTDDMLEQIQLVSESMEMSKQDVIRLSVSAGLKALKKMGYEGLAKKVSEEIMKDISKAK